LYWLPPNRVAIGLRLLACNLAIVVTPLRAAADNHDFALH
jgi:hypothetical protein